MILVYNTCSNYYNNYNTCSLFELITILNDCTKQLKMEDTKHLMLMWDLLHVVGCLSFLFFPYTVCTLCILIGVLWKREFSIVRNMCLFTMWWHMVTTRSTILGVISTTVLFYKSPRLFHEAISRLLPIHAIWYLNLFYPPPQPSNKTSVYSLTKNNNSNNNNSTADNNTNIDVGVSIILCNMNESIETMKINIDSIVKSKKFAEKELSIQHIRLVLSDGGSKNIEEIRQEFGDMFDLISIIPGGKLRGRHVATLDEPSDIIIAYDSDRNYDIKNTYNHLQPFLHNHKGNENRDITEDGVVGTTHYVNSDGTLPFNGGNSAYLKDVYLDNPFDITIREAKWIWQEEEVDWRNRLARCGKVLSVEANYSDIDPIPLMACVKRILNLKNSFGGGDNRSDITEDNYQIAAKVATTLVLTNLVSCIL